MKLTVTPLERSSPAKRKAYTIMSGCFVQTHPNIGAVFGWTNNTLGGTLSYVLPTVIFHTGS